MMTTDGPSPRVLLVDDNAAVARALASLLSRAGYEVLTAGSAREAEERLSERFDVLVLDLRMPAMRGDAFYYLARARQPWLTDRTLFITGDITEQAETIVRQTGCGMLPKPFRGEELLKAVVGLVPIPLRTIPRVG